MDTRICKKCKIDKPLSEFQFHKGGFRRIRTSSISRRYDHSYYNLNCKQCRKEWGKKKYNTNMEFRVKKILRTILNSAVKFHYCPCVSSVSDVIAGYTGYCNICNKPDGEDKRRLGVDHCHTHGHFRGWLCMNCNILIGQGSDNPVVLLKAASYLEGNR